MRDQNSAWHKNDRVAFTEYIGSIAGAILGCAAGVSVGIWIGASLAPILGGAAGLFVGIWTNGFIFKTFPRLRSGQTLPQGAARAGISGLIAGLFIGDLIGTFCGFDRAYSTLIGSSLGLYIGVRWGMAPRGEK